MNWMKTFIREGREETRRKEEGCVCLRLRSNRCESAYPKSGLLRVSSRPSRIAFGFSG
jgi:hypothetical protein